MGALTELEEHGADVAAREQVDVIAAAGSVPAGFPSLPTRVNAGRVSAWLRPPGAGADGARPFPRRRRARAWRAAVRPGQRP